VRWKKMIEEKLSSKITVLFSKTTDRKLNELCRKTERSKSNIIRYIVQDYVEKVIENRGT
jgi:predicted DNA-binding protein